MKMVRLLSCEVSNNIISSLVSSIDPSSSPDNVTAMTVSSTSIMVTWNMVLPIDQNGVITMYEVMYTPLEVFGGAIGTNTTRVSGSELSVVLMGLQEYVNYTLSVRAYTSVGMGLDSAPAVVILTPQACMFVN